MPENCMMVHPLLGREQEEDKEEEVEKLVQTRAWIRYGQTKCNSDCSVIAAASGGVKQDGRCGMRGGIDNTLKSRTNHIPLFPQCGGQKP